MPDQDLTSSPEQKTSIKRKLAEKARKIVTSAGNVAEDFLQEVGGGAKAINNVVADKLNGKALFGKTSKDVGAPALFASRGIEPVANGEVGFGNHPAASSGDDFVFRVKKSLAQGMPLNNYEISSALSERLRFLLSSCKSFSEAFIYFPDNRCNALDNLAKALKPKNEEGSFEPMDSVEEMEAHFIVLHFILNNQLNNFETDERAHHSRNSQLIQNALKALASSELKDHDGHTSLYYVLRKSGMEVLSKSFLQELRESFEKTEEPPESFYKALYESEQLISDDQKVEVAAHLVEVCPSVTVDGFIGWLRREHGNNSKTLRKKLWGKKSPGRNEQSNHAPALVAPTTTAYGNEGDTRFTTPLPTTTTSGSKESEVNSEEDFPGNKNKQASVASDVENDSGRSWQVAESANVALPNQVVVEAEGGEVRSAPVAGLPNQSGQPAAILPLTISQLPKVRALSQFDETEVSRLQKILEGENKEIFKLNLADKEGGSYISLEFSYEEIESMISKVRKKNAPNAKPLLDKLNSALQGFLEHSTKVRERVSHEKQMNQEGGRPCFVQAAFAFTTKSSFDFAGFIKFLNDQSKIDWTDMLDSEKIFMGTVFSFLHAYFLGLSDNNTSLISSLSQALTHIGFTPKDAPDFPAWLQPGFFGFIDKLFPSASLLTEQPVAEGSGGASNDGAPTLSTVSSFSSSIEQPQNNGGGEKSLESIPRSASSFFSSANREGTGKTAAEARSSSSTREERNGSIGYSGDIAEVTSPPPSRADEIHEGQLQQLEEARENRESPRKTRWLARAWDFVVSHKRKILAGLAIVGFSAVALTAVAAILVVAAPAIATTFATVAVAKALASIPALGVYLAGGVTAAFGILGVGTAGYMSRHDASRIPTATIFLGALPPVAVGIVGVAALLVIIFPPVAAALTSVAVIGAFFSWLPLAGAIGVAAGGVLATLACGVGVHRREAEKARLSQSIKLHSVQAGKPGFFAYSGGASLPPVSSDPPGGEERPVKLGSSAPGNSQ